MEHQAFTELANLKALVTADRIFSALRAAFVLVIAFFGTPIARRGIERVLSHRLHAQQMTLVLRLATYGVWALALTWSLRELGFEISVLLGAAGVVTVAVGFASQTSVSNLISGLFLIVERPFGLGDIIDVSGVVGEVLSIDLLSVKLRTSDNLFVRIPNETLLKSTVLNMTRYDTRACVIIFWAGVAADLTRVRDIALNVAAQEKLCLQQPAPTFACLGYDDAALKLQLTIWCERAAMQAVQNAVYTSLQRAFAQEHIPLPMPSRRIVTQ